MKVMTAIALASFAASLYAYEGPTFSVSAWRGETVYAEVPDNLARELEQTVSHEASVLADFTNRVGAVELQCIAPVSYADKIHGAHLAQRLDFVSDYSSEGSLSPVSLARIAVKAETRPGVYALGPLQLKVVDRVLPPPAEWKYYLDLWQHPWAAARWGRTEPFSERHYIWMKPVLETLAECGQKVLTTTLLDLPWNHQCYDAYHSMIGRVKKADGSWAFDYTVFDAYVAFGRACGVGPDIACYTMCPWGYVVRWQNEKGEVQRATAKPGTPAFEDYWGDFLVDFAAHLKAKGWFEHTYIAMDERSPEDVKNISEFIQKKAPGFKISMAGNRKPSDFKGIAIDNYSQVLADVTPEFLQELDERRAKGYYTTFYVCCWPLQPNTFMTSENDEAYWLGAFPGLAGFDGFLRWAANSWPVNPYENAAFGNWAPGDTFLVYPTGHYSARLVNLRAGIVAAEKLRILKDAGLFADEIQAAKQKSDFKTALAGKLDLPAFRRQLEKLVNRE